MRTFGPSVIAATVAALVTCPFVAALAWSQPENDLQRELARQRRSHGATSALVAIVYNAQGEIFPNVSVTLHRRGDSCTDDTVVAAGTSTSGGVVVFRDVAPGRYRLCAAPERTAEAAGYRVTPTDVELAQASITGLEIRLTPVIEERVDVPASETPVDGRVRSTLERVFTRTAIDEMMLPSGRTLQSFTTLVPGMIVTESTGTLAQSTAVGQRRLSNGITVDGISANVAIDARGTGIGPAGSGGLPAYSTSGGTQTFLPFGDIEDIEIRTAAAPTPSARTPGAQIRVVTRAGGDRFRGSLYADTRSRQLAAADWFDNAAGRERDTRYLSRGASVGGPIVPGWLGYHATWEHEAIARPYGTTVRVPSDAVRQAAPPEMRPLLDAFPRPNGPEIGDGLAEFSHTIPADSTLSVWSGRVDATSARHRVFGRFSYGRSDGDALTEADEPYLSFDHRERTRSVVATLGLTNTWRSTLLHELRANVTEHHGALVGSVAPYGGAEPLPAGFLDVDAWTRLNVFPGPGGFLILGRTGEGTTKQVQVVDTWTSMHGRHQWTFGADVRRVIASSDQASRQTYTFSDLDALVRGEPRHVILDYRIPPRARLDSWAMFVQDTFRVSPHLSLEYGLRYSVKPAPSSATDVHPLLFDDEALPALVAREPGAPLWKTSWTDLAPRVAGAYQIHRSPRWDTAIGAAWSVVFDDFTFPGASAFGRGFPYASRVGLVQPRFPAPVPAPPSSFDDAEAYAFPEDFRSSRTDQWHVSVEQALGTHQRLAAGYVGTRGRRLPYWYAYAPGRMQTVHAFSNDGAADYRALLLHYVRRLSRGFQGGVTYTWSVARDNDSGESPTPNLPPAMSAPSINWGFSDFDRRHVLHVMAGYEIPAPRWNVLRTVVSGWRIDLTGQVRSGAPVSVTYVRDFGSGLYTVRPDAVPEASAWIDDPLSATGRQMNRAAFEIPSAPRQGTLERNALRASPLRQVDLSLSRAIRLRGVVLWLRVDVFNLLNTPNVGPPESDLSVEAFGRPYESAAKALGSGSLTQGGLVPIHQVGGPRALQLGIRLRW